MMCETGILPNERPVPIVGFGEGCGKESHVNPPSRSPYPPMVEESVCCFRQTLRNGWDPGSGNLVR